MNHRIDCQVLILQLIRLIIYVCIYEVYSKSNENLASISCLCGSTASSERVNLQQATLVSWNILSFVKSRREFWIKCSVVFKMFMMSINDENGIKDISINNGDITIIGVTEEIWFSYGSRQVIYSNFWTWNEWQQNLFIRCWIFNENKYLLTLLATQIFLP